MKSEDKLEGATTFRAWKTKIDLILEKNDVLDNVKCKVSKPSDNEVQAKYVKDGIATRSTIVDSINYHLIPYVANLDTSKKIFHALVGLYLSYQKRLENFPERLFPVSKTETGTILV